MTQVRDLRLLFAWFTGKMMATLALPENVAKDDWSDSCEEVHLEQAADHMETLKKTSPDDKRREFIGHCVDAANHLMMAAGVAETNGNV